MKNSVAEPGKELNNLLEMLDRVILEKALQWGRELYRRVVEQLDSWLLRARGDCRGMAHTVGGGAES